MRRANGVVSGLFLAAVFCASFDKVHWNAAGTVYLADVTSLLFLVAWTIDRLGEPVRRVPRTVAVLLVFFFSVNKVWLEPLWETGAGRFALGAWVVLLIAGWFAIKKIVEIEV